jgi:hypothetical protein
VPIFKLVQNSAETVFNPQKVKHLFESDETDDAIVMIQSRQRDFKCTETLKPFYVKAVKTLRELVVEEFDLSHLYVKYLDQYSEVRIL